jgi:hypothetical protein
MHEEGSYFVSDHCIEPMLKFAPLNRSLDVVNVIADDIAIIAGN